MKASEVTILRKQALWYATTEAAREQLNALSDAEFIENCRIERELDGCSWVAAAKYVGQLYDATSY